MKRLFNAVRHSLTVYNQWTGEERVSREMRKNVVVAVVSILVFVLGFTYEITEAQITAGITWALSGWDQYLRITSKGGESILKEEVRAKKELSDELKNLDTWLERDLKKEKKKEKSLMPDPLNDN